VRGPRPVLPLRGPATRCEKRHPDLHESGVGRRTRGIAIGFTSSSWRPRTLRDRRRG
jgi:hypothetical protein